MTCMTEQRELLSGFACGCWLRVPFTAMGMQRDPDFSLECVHARNFKVSSDKDRSVTWGDVWDGDTHLVLSQLKKKLWLLEQIGLTKRG